MNSRFGAALTAALSLVIGCGYPLPEGGPVPTPDSTTETDTWIVRSNRARITAPNVPVTDTAALVAGGNEFALDLYRELRAEPGNFFASPFSASSALAMTYAGARGTTETQMQQALHFTLPQQSLHPAFNSLDLALAGRGAGAAGSDAQGFRLKIANSLFGAIGYPFDNAFLDTLAENYGAGVRIENFKDDPEGSRQHINAWVAQQTEDRIQELLRSGMVTGATRLVLVNAIYFNAAWADPFSDKQTASRAFHLLDGSSVQVSTMNRMGEYRYATGAGYQAVELPYDGNEVSMLVLVPDAGGLDAFEQSLTASRLGAISASLTPTSVVLGLPRWKTESEYSLRQTLSNLGMPVAFDGARADFSGIAGVEPLHISDVIQKANVSVNESGTEAAAATAVVVVGGSAPGAFLYVDRPFIYVIRDNPTGAILFVGRVVNPLGT